MNTEKNLSKFKPTIIIILLFSLAFFLRSESAHIYSVSDGIRSTLQDEKGLQYFSELDSYYNYRLTWNYLNNGHLGDTVVNNVPWDLHSYYPSGRSADYPPLIVYITAFVYKFLNTFANVPLNAVAIWLAPFMASLAVIPAYLFVRKITNDYGGIAAGILVGTTPMYFTHTFAGFFDTDMFNMLLPILVVWFFAEGTLAKDIKNRSIFVVLSVISMLLFAMAWEGWWYLFYLVIGTGVMYLLVSNYLFKMNIIRSFNEYSSKIKWFADQPVLFSLIVFVIISSILISILGPSSFLNSLISSLGAGQLQNAVQGTSYPNVYLSVVELQVPNLWEVVGRVGGILPVIFGIISVPWLILKLKQDIVKNENKKTPKRRNRSRKGKKTKAKIVEEKIEKKEIPISYEVMESKKNYLFYAILFSLWILGTAYAVTKGVRFVAAFSIPITLSTGVFIGLMAFYFKKHIENARYSALAVLFLIAVVAYAPVTATQSFVTSDQSIPSADDSMYNSMLWVKNNTPKNTVLTSWWDYGHLFTAVADRPVTFDGGSQNTPRAYWVGRALLTSNENLSTGILRMLTSSGDQGILTLERYTKDTGKSVEILNKILPVDKNAAQLILTNNYKLTPDQAQNVLKYTHPDKSTPHALILSEDMITKAGVWSQFGNWNFKKGTGQGYGYSMATAVIQQDNGITVISASNGVIGQLNGSKIAVAARYTQNNLTQILDPHKLIVVQNDKVVMNQLVSNESSFSIALIQDKNSYLTVLMSKELEDSMFTRLYFMKGAGLSKFKLLHTDGGVRVWKAS